MHVDGYGSVGRHGFRLFLSSRWKKHNIAARSPMPEFGLTFVSFLCANGANKNVPDDP